MRKHRDISFEVRCDEHREGFTSADKAMAKAFVLAVTGREVILDVLVFSRAGAKAWAGDTGAESYAEDPDATVFERYRVSVSFEGRIA